MVQQPIPYIDICVWYAPYVYGKNIRMVYNAYYTTRTTLTSMIRTTFFEYICTNMCDNNIKNIA